MTVLDINIFSKCQNSSPKTIRRRNSTYVKMITEELFFKMLNNFYKMIRIKQGHHFARFSL